MAVWRLCDSSADILTDEFARGGVALDDLRCASNPKREHQWRHRIAWAGGLHDDIVNRKGGSLLELNADHAASVSKFRSTVTRQQTSEVLHCHLSLESHAATACCIGAGPALREDGVAAAALVVGQVVWAARGHPLPPVAYRLILASVARTQARHPLSVAYTVTA